MEQTGNIIIVEAEDDFKRVHKSIIQNENIDCETLGIYMRLIVLGLKWRLYIKGLSTHLGLSDARIRKAISTLEREGYIVRTSVKGDDGKFKGWNYKIMPYPISEEERSSAGKKKADIAENGLPQKPTSRCMDLSENGEDNIYKLNTTINLNKEETKNNISCQKQEIDNFVDEIYKLYPTKCPMRNSSLGKCNKDRDRIKRLLKVYSQEQIRKVVVNEIETKYGKSYMQNFSTFLNNFPDPMLLSPESEGAKEEAKEYVINGVNYQ